MKMFMSVVFVIGLLYVLKVPNVVTFVNQIRDVIMVVVTYVLDELTHVRERHPFVFMAIPLLLFYLMFDYHRSSVDA